MRKRVLFISGSLGLGHIVRDIAITNELRRLQPGLEIDWMASEPATMKLVESGDEKIHLLHLLLEKID